MKKYYKYLDVQIPVTISYRSNTSKRTIMVDSKISDIIKKLNNDLNFNTLNCCSGHLVYSPEYEAWTLSLFYIDIEYSENDTKLQAFLNALPDGFRYQLQSYRDENNDESNLHATIKYNVDISDRDFRVICKAYNKAHKKLRKYIKKFSDAYRTPTSFETNSPTCSRSEYRSIEFNIH